MTKQGDEIITLAEFCGRTGKTVRQVKRLFKIHAGLKHHIAGERASRVNASLWQRILENPKGYVKLNRA